ncbi:MAG TPA: hypothetical protein VN282_21285 [Pyrinomonadaceae bacterium]|nr:hypothetical protein [Pyrinomonadaceae bacterium]
MMSYTANAGGQRREDGPKVVCVWCGEVIRGASKARKRMCQPCFERMMREYSLAHRHEGALPHASER